MSAQHGVLRRGGSPFLAWSVMGACLFGLAASPLLEAASASAHEAGRGRLEQLPSEFALILTGGELLDGTIRDSHVPFLAQTLRPLGLRCVQTLLVDDSPADLAAALRTATARASLVIVTGGLGPTVNDITRDVLSEGTGVPLVESAALLAELGRRFDQSPRDLRENLRRQVRIPASGSYLPNDHGTAVGLVFEPPVATVIALPGPPGELRPMVNDHLVPWLRQRLGLPAKGLSVKLRFVGLGQSAIDSTLREAGVIPANVVTASQFEANRVDFVFSLPDDTEAGREALKRLETAAVAHLGTYLYATNANTLEQVVWSLLEPRGDSLVVSETPGPYLAMALVAAQLPESADIRSFSAYDEVSLGLSLGLGSGWEDGAGSGLAQRAELLGRAARSRTEADWALVVLAPRVSGQGTLRVALGCPDGSWETWEVPVRISPEAGRARTVTTVLDHIRRVVPQLSTNRIATPSTIR